MKWSKDEIVELSNVVFLKLVEGKNDEEIADDMNVSINEIKKIKKHLYDEKSLEIRNKPVEHVYVEYMLSQMQNIEDLSRLIEDNRNVSAKGLSAVVGAIRTRADIYDRILAKGQECGLIKKVPNRTESVFGIFVEDLSNKELRNLIVKQVDGLGSLVNRFGEQNILELPAPEILHQGPKLDQEFLRDDENTINLGDNDYEVSETHIRKKMKRMKAHFAED